MNNSPEHDSAVAYARGVQSLYNMDFKAAKGAADLLKTMYDTIITYAEHFESCKSWTSPTRAGCTCGLDKMLMDLPNWLPQSYEG